MLEPGDLEELHVRLSDLEESIREGRARQDALQRALEERPQRPGDQGREDAVVVSPKPKKNAPHKSKDATKARKPKAGAKKGKRRRDTK